MNDNSVIQIGGPEKGQCGTAAEAKSARSCHEAPTLTSQFSHHLELDANEVDGVVSNAGDVSLTEEGEVPVSSVVFSQTRSDNRWRPDVFPRCMLSLPRHQTSQGLQCFFL